MTNKNGKLDSVLELMRTRGMSRRQALKALSLGGLGLAAGPTLSRLAWAETNQLTGPGGLPLARPDQPVELPLYQDPIKSGLEPETGGTFNIYNYADYLDPALMDKFGEMYDVEVQVTMFDSQDQAIKRMASEAVDVDVTEILPDRLTQAIAGKLLQPLNHDYIGNFGETIWRELQNPFYDRGSTYTVPYTVYSSGIGWRADMVDEDIPSLENPWSIFWQAHDYKGRVGLINEARELLALAMAHREYFNVNTTDSDIIDQALDDLKALISICNPLVDQTNYQTIPQGTRALGHAWSGSMLVGGMWYMPDDVSWEDLRYWTGEKGRSWVQNDCWAIPVASRKPVLAHLWLDFILEENNAYNNFVNFTGYQPPLNSINPDSLVSAGVIPESLSSAVMRAEDFGPGSQQIMAVPTDALVLYQNAYSKFVSGV